MHAAPQILAVAHGNGQEKLLLSSSQWSREPVVKRGQMDEGMVPVSLLRLSCLQQWEDEAKTMQREDDN